ncbi:MAG: helix-turn-helix domain-containing protein [Dysgonamonadaceae bacterium]|jgi:transcriptional regulator with XRE-family HTH domain|nr:helix-turn-helix domain-containing protein [Dysgonamonadaceae bacterium]
MNGKKLKEKIKLCGISLREVAELLGISEQNLQNKLNADDVKVSFLVDLSRKLNKDMYYFLDMQYPTQKNNSVTATNNLLLREKDERLREKDEYILELKETIRGLKNKNTTATRTSCRPQKSL